MNASRMITFDMIRELREFANGRNLITSLYLATVPERGDFVERANRMFDDALDRLERFDYTERQKESVRNDIAKLREFVREVLPAEVKSTVPFVVKGIAAFSSTSRNLFRVHYLPRPLRERLVFDYTPYIRPLTLLLDEYKRYLVVVVDHKKARFYEMFMGSIVDAEKLVDINLKARFKSPPVRLKRAYNYLVAEHLMRVVDVIDMLMATRNYDLLIVGEAKPVRGQLQLYLPFRLRQKLAGAFVADPTDPIERILDEARKIEIEVEKAEERKLVEELKRRLAEGELAVAGLRDTLDALMHNQVQTLIVAEGFEAEGVRCPKCGFLGVDEETCPSCGAETYKVRDVVDDAIEEAIEQGVGIEHVIQKELLEGIGSIGALLRFPEMQEAEQ